MQKYMFFFFFPFSFLYPVWTLGKKALFPYYFFYFFLSICLFIFLQVSWGSICFFFFFAYCIYIPVWNSGQTAITPIYCFRLLVFETETEWIYCSVLEQYVNIIRVKFFHQMVNTHFFNVLLTVHPCVIFCKWSQLGAHYYSVYLFQLLYMFRATMCQSSAEIIVSMRHWHLLLCMGGGLVSRPDSHQYRVKNTSVA